MAVTTIMVTETIPVTTMRQREFELDISINSDKIITTPRDTETDN